MMPTWFSILVGISGCALGISIGMGGSKGFGVFIFGMGLLMILISLSSRDPRVQELADAAGSGRPRPAGGMSAVTAITVLFLAGIVMLAIAGSAAIGVIEVPPGMTVWTALLGAASLGMGIFAEIRRRGAARPNQNESPT